VTLATAIRQWLCGKSGHGVLTPLYSDISNGRVRLVAEQCASCGACVRTLKGVPNKSGRVGRNQSTRRRVR